jgi:hypothetical protein
VSSESATVKRPERGGQPDTIGRIRLVRPSSRVGQPSASTHKRVSEAPVEAMASSESAANDAAQCRRKESTVGGTPVRGEIEVAGNTGVISARTRRPTVAPNLATEGTTAPTPRAGTGRAEDKLRQHASPGHAVGSRSAAGRHSRAWHVASNICRPPSAWTSGVRLAAGVGVFFNIQRSAIRHPLTG